MADNSHPTIAKVLTMTHAANRSEPDSSGQIFDNSGKTLTYTQLAEKLQCSVRTIRRRVALGQIQPISREIFGRQLPRFEWPQCLQPKKEKRR